MAPSSYPGPPTRAHEPDFAKAGPSPLGPEGPGLDGGHGPRRRAAPRGSMLPWVLVAGALACGAWAYASIIVPLNRAVVGCEDQLKQVLAVQAARPAVVAAKPAPEALPGSTQLKAPEPGPGAALALIEPLSHALAPFCDLGAVAVHPDEEAVRVMLAADVMWGAKLSEVLALTADVLHSEARKWRVEVRASGASGPPKRHVGRHSRRNAAGATPNRDRRLAELLLALDGALTPRGISWGVTLADIAPGAAELRIESSAGPTAQ